MKLQEKVEQIRRLRQLCANCLHSIAVWNEAAVKEESDGEPSRTLHKSADELSQYLLTTKIIHESEYSFGDEKNER